MQISFLFFEHSTDRRSFNSAALNNKGDDAAPSPVNLELALHVSFKLIHDLIFLHQTNQLVSNSTIDKDQ